MGKQAVCWQFVVQRDRGRAQRGLRRRGKERGRGEDRARPGHRATARFAFVEMGSDGEAAQAIETLNGREIQGRPISVSEARERAARGGEAVVVRRRPRP